MLSTLHLYLEKRTANDQEFWKLHGRLLELKELIHYVRDKR